MRHYKKLKQINDKRPRSAQTTNMRFEKKLSEQRMPNQYEKAKQLKVKQDNTKLRKALDDISSTWGRLGPYSFAQDCTQKKKTLGFKYKSNIQLIRENMVDLELI